MTRSTRSVVRRVSADVAATLLTGVGAGVLTEGKTDEEWRKRLTAKLRESPGVVVFDNLARRLDSAALAAALTAPSWEDRILGSSQNMRLAIRCVWIATANNPQVSNEIARRLSASDWRAIERESAPASSSTSSGAHGRSSSRARGMSMVGTSTRSPGTWRR